MSWWWVALGVAFILAGDAALLWLVMTSRKPVDIRTGAVID